MIPRQGPAGLDVPLKKSQRGVEATKCTDTLSYFI